MIRPDPAEGFGTETDLRGARPVRAMRSQNPADYCWPGCNGLHHHDVQAPRWPSDEDRAILPLSLREPPGPTAVPESVPDRARRYALWQRRVLDELERQHICMLGRPLTTVVPEWWEPPDRAPERPHLLTWLVTRWENVVDRWRLGAT